MVADGLYWDIIFVGDQFVVQALLVRFKWMSDDLQKCGFHGLSVLLDLIFDDWLDNELEDLADRNHS